MHKQSVDQTNTCVQNRVTDEFIYIEGFDEPLKVISYSYCKENYPVYRIIDRFGNFRDVDGKYVRK